MQPDPNKIEPPEEGAEPWWKDQAKAPTPPLPNTPMPVVNQAQIAQKDPITNLTRTETALLSPTEKVIAGRT